MSEDATVEEKEAKNNLGSYPEQPDDQGAEGGSEGGWALSMSMDNGHGGQWGGGEAS